MKWLDEFKKLYEEDEWTIDIIEPRNDPTIKRLIEIAEGAEFEGWHVDAEANCCPICGGFGIHMDGSDDFAPQDPCPYSDEWKP